MIDGVHDNAADGRANAQMTLAASLTDAHVLVLGVANRSDGSAGVDGHLADFAGGQADLRERAFLGHDLRGGAGSANHLAALAYLDLNVVDQGAQRDVGQRQAVAGLDVGVDAAHHGVANLQVQRREDVSLLAVGVNQESDEAGTVGIVLDGGNLRGDVVLVALEVDDAVLATHSAALVANGNFTGGVAASLVAQVGGQGALGLFLGELVERKHRHEAPCRRGRLINANSHLLDLPITAPCPRRTQWAWSPS